MHFVGPSESSGERGIAAAERPAASSWYGIARSKELRRGAVLRRSLAGREIVVFRGESGAPAAVGAYCPHLGAHLGRGGRVEGDSIVCPFHRFRFDGAGTCVATGYGTKPPQSARLDSWPVCERAGFVLAWFGAAGEPPTWGVPEPDHAGWTGVWTRSFEIAGHPQDTVENSVDYGHLPYIHDYRNPRLREAPKADGPLFTIGLTFSRPRGLLPGTAPFDLDIDILAHGLGWSIVSSRVAALDLTLRHYVLARPTSPGRMAISIGLQGRFGARRPGLLRLLPAKTLASLAMPFALQQYAADLRQDFPIWEHKRYLERPALADGDGPIGAFRQWATQFYAARSREEAPQLSRSTSV